MRSNIKRHSASAALVAGVLSALGLGNGAIAAAAGAATPDSAGGLEEITVTAEKFKSTVLDTPISISALSGDQLTAAGLTSVQGIIREVPGLSTRSAGPGLTEYEARGLASNGGAAPTVGFYLDEIPLSPPALSQSGKVVIDPDLYDIERVEVLRGPQGTLYGSSSMGGTVKVITNKPKLGIFEGSAQGNLSDTKGGGANYGGKLMLNLPLGDALALRVVASDTYRSGWIDLVNVGAAFPLGNFANLPTTPVQSVTKGANDQRISSGRAALLFKPSDDLSVTVTALTQHMAMGGYDLLDSTPFSTSPGPVWNAHYEAFPFREGIHDDIHVYGLDIQANLGFADLTSATSYFDRLGWQTQDASESIYIANGGGTPFVAVPYSEKDPSRQVSQEIRLTSHDTGALHWVAGAFYSRLNSVWNEISNNPALLPAGMPVTDRNLYTDASFFTSENPYKVAQTALFADGSWKFDEHWKLSAGLRWYKYNSRQDEVSWGYDGPYPNAAAGFANGTTTRAKDQGFNPRINLSYEPDKDLMVYATIAKGFRPGGANQILPDPSQPPYCALPGPRSFGPDSVWNYEVGEKAKLFGNWLTINSDFYYIKWNGVQQVFTLICGYQFYDNAGNGRSFGPEIEVNAKLSDEWSLAFSGAYTDSKINSPSANYLVYLTSQAIPPPGPNAYCQKAAGCTAPIMNVAKDTASLAVVYSTEIAPDYRLTARLSDSYTGSLTDLALNYGLQLPGYSIANARVTVAHDKWSATLFVDNLTDKVALTSANNTSFQFNTAQLVRYGTNQPRTFGTQVNFKF